MPYGQDGTLAISFQDSYGTPKNSPLNFIPLIDEDISLNIEELISAEMGSTGFDEGASYPGKRSSNGSLNMDIDMDTLGVCLRALMGPASVSSTGPITQHTFFPRTADFDTKAASEPLTIQVDLADTGSSQQFYDCVANELEFGIAAGELYKLKMGVIGGKFNQVVDASASYGVGSKWTWDSTSYHIDGAAIDELMELTVKITENLEEKFFLDGTTEPGSVKRTAPRSIEISGTMLFNDQVEYQEFISQSERPLYLNMAAGSFGIKIYAPAFRYTAYPVALSGPQQLEVAFSGKAKYNTSALVALQITLTNTHGIYI